MKILSVSDMVHGLIYSPRIATRFNDVDLVISCGDLPFYYLEYIISSLDIPLYYVRGNHAGRVEVCSSIEKKEPWGGIDLHSRCKRDQSGLLLAGIEGCLRYNYGPYQYTQLDMWMMVFRLVPGLILNKIRHGRYLDIFVTHAAPWKIHDKTDRPHIGVKAFRWMHRVFKPPVHLHGHIHIYRQDTVKETFVDSTRVINTYGYRELEFEVASQTRTRRV